MLQFQKNREFVMNVSLTKKQKDYIAAQLESGDYQNSSEVVRDALRLHEYYRHRIIEDLRREIAKGWDGEKSPRTVEDIINKSR
jgi:antitoxin ParD1/3/4